MDKELDWDFIHKVNRAYWKFPDDLLEKILQKNPKIKNILDVGCGKGELVAHLRNLGYAAEGIDISSEAVHAKEKNSSLRRTVPRDLLRLEIWDSIKSQNSGKTS